MIKRGKHKRRWKLLCYSKPIEEFLAYIRQAKEQNQFAKNTEREKENETQDILHRLELSNDKYHITAKLAKKLREVRQERRHAKDTVSLTEPILAWSENNKPAIRSLEKLLGELRKSEKLIENRFYTAKTDVMQDIIKK